MAKENSKQLTKIKSKLDDVFNINLNLWDKTARLRPGQSMPRKIQKSAKGWPKKQNACENNFFFIFSTKKRLLSKRRFWL